MWICVAVAAATFAADLAMPSSVASGVPYAVLVLVASLARRRRILVGGAVASSALILVGYALSGGGGTAVAVLLNRAMALALVWIMTAILIARELSEAERRESEGKFRRIVETAPDGIVMAGPDGRIVLVNEHVVELFGHEREELLEQPMEILLPERFRQGVEAPSDGSGAEPLRSLIDDGADLYGLHRDGTEFPVEVGLSPMETREGLMQIVTIRDVSARKEAESRAASSLRRYYGLFDQSPHGILVVDPETGHPIEFNDAVLEILGYAPDELIRLPVTALDRAAEGAGARARIDEVCREGSSRFEAKLSAKDGAEKNVVVSMRMMELDGRAVVYAILEDITVRKRAEEAKRQLEQHLERAQRIQALGTLAGGIAHDFNNLLQAIMGFGGEVRARVQEDPEALACIEEVLSASGRAKDLVSQILTYSRQGNRTEDVVDVCAVAQEVGRLLRASLPPRIELRLDPPSERGCAFVGDSSQVHQVMVNLATNAAQAMGEGHGTLRLSVEPVDLSEARAEAIPTSRPGRHVRISVADTGHGMDEATLEKIYDPYFTTKADKGTGLGLSTVHSVVLGYGGGIEVESRVGEGTTFTIYLPSPETEIVTRRDVGTTALAGSGHILLVDDQAEIGKVGQLVLKRFGYDVTLETSPTEALETFRARPGDFDLVMTDQCMPAMTGLELARKVRRLAPDIPLLLTTGFDESLTEEKLRAAGIGTLLMKPWKAEELVAAIEQAVHARERVPALEVKGMPGALR